jgi:hypothetical protein
MYHILHVCCCANQVYFSLDNIVSRFHNDIAKTNRESGVDAIMSTPESFREHCSVYNKRYLKDEQASMLFNKELLELTANVPCRADFFRYVECKFYFPQLNGFFSAAKARQLTFHISIRAQPGLCFATRHGVGNTDSSL